MNCGCKPTIGNRRRTRRDLRAFSLVELLVVISVIALLVAIVVPWVARARQRALIASCASNLHQIVNGLFCYARDNSRTMFPCRPGGTASTDDLSPLYPRYLGDINVFRCPSSKHDHPTEAEHIQFKTSLQGSYGERAQLSYEYPGEHLISPKRRVDQKLAMLAYDDDGRGVNKQTDLDSHAPDGGNMSFIDGSVNWIPAKDWNYHSWAGLYAWMDPPQKYPKPE